MTWFASPKLTRSSKRNVLAKMESKTPSAQPQQNGGSRLYNPFTIFFYNIWVLWFSNTYAWQCPTSTVLLPLYRSAVGKRHLDVGVGSGYYPSKALVDSPCTELTLADLNMASLEASKRGIEAALHANNTVKISTLVADASEPLPLPEAQKFDSISLFYLLHCMPGPPERKCRVFKVMARQLAADGVLVGSTILGREIEMNLVAKGLMKLYNSTQVFDNWDDSRAVFEKGLGEAFDEVNVWVVGRILLFTARKPKV